MDTLDTHTTPTTLDELSLLIQRLHVGSGITFFARIGSNAGYFFEKHDRGEEYSWQGGAYDDRQELETDEELYSLIEQLFTEIDLYSVYTTYKIWTAQDERDAQRQDEGEQRSYGRSQCEDFPCCGHEQGCCPAFDEAGRQLDMKCTCGASVPIGSRSSLCNGCLNSVMEDY